MDFIFHTFLSGSSSESETIRALKGKNWAQAATIGLKIGFNVKFVQPFKWWLSYIGLVRNKE